MTDDPLLKRCRALYRNGIYPALRDLGARYDTPEARAMLYAIAMQESRAEHRRQIAGPARGYWQFERGGGVHGVLTHHATRDAAQAMLHTYRVAPDDFTVWQALEFHDPLAAAFARLLLYADPLPLPRREAGPDAAWQTYVRNWRPGKPHPETWAGFWEQAWLLATEGRA